MGDAVAGGGTPVSLGSLVVSILGNTDSYEKAILRAQNMTAQAGKALEQVAGTVERAGRTLTAALTLPILGIGIASVKSFAQFDDSMTRSLALFGNVSKDLRGQLEATANQIAGTSISSADELARTYGVLAHAGYNAQQAQAALGTIQQFAAANGLEATGAARMLADAQRVLGLRSDDVAKNTKNLTTLEDELMQTSLLSGASVEELAEALEHHGAAAMKEFNVPLERGLGLLTEFAQQGLKGGRAGIALSEYLRSHGGRTPDAAGLESAIAGAGGTTTRIATQVTGDFASQIKILGHNVEEVAREIGGMLVPWVKEASLEVSKGLVWWRSLTQEQKNLGLYVSAGAAALGPLLIGLGGIVKIAGSVATYVGTAGAGTVSWIAALALVPVALASVTDAIGLTNTGLLDLINTAKVGSKTVGEHVEDIALDAAMTIKQAWALATGNMQGYFDAQLEREAQAKYIGDNRKADQEKRDKTTADNKAKAEAQATEIVGRAEKAAGRPQIPLIDLENEKLEKNAQLKREAQNFAVTSLRRFALNGPGGLARAITGVPAASPAGVGLALGGAQAAAPATLAASASTGTIDLGGGGNRASIRAAALENGIALPQRAREAQTSPKRVEDDLSMTRVPNVSNPLIAGRSTQQLQTLEVFFPRLLRQVEILTEVTRSRTLPATVR